MQEQFKSCYDFLQRRLPIIFYGCLIKVVMNSVILNRLVWVLIIFCLWIFSWLEFILNFWDKVFSPLNSNVLLCCFMMTLLNLDKIFQLFRQSLICLLVFMNLWSKISIDLAASFLVTQTWSGSVHQCNFQIYSLLSV